MRVISFFKTKGCRPSRVAAFFFCLVGVVAHMLEIDEQLIWQWSVDVMRNGNDYYIIDMALAENSALNDCVPSNRLRAYPQQWLPGESNN